MPLSEHEQQLLDQIERELYAEDPKFASTVRGTKMSRSPARRRRLQGAALFLSGVGLLVLGVIVPFRPAQIPLISVIGFLVMFFGVVVAITSARKRSASSSKSRKSGHKSSPRRRSSLVERMEERFRQRFED
jgi:hypothetical protein